MVLVLKKGKIFMNNSEEKITKKIKIFKIIIKILKIITIINLILIAIDFKIYNYIYDYLSAFTPFNLSDELQQVLDESRKEIITEYTPEQLFAFLLHSATPANFRRFQSAELKDCFIKKVKGWSEVREEKNDKPNINRENVSTQNEGNKEALEER